MAYSFDTTEERSKLMSKIRSNNTAPEIILRKKLWSLGYRYRLHVKNLPGKPDIVFKSKKTAIFIDGEFWHGKNWELKKSKIKQNKDYWLPKIERNMLRDQNNNAQLKLQGWQVIRFWQNDVMKNLDDCVNVISLTLNHSKI